MKLLLVLLSLALACQNNSDCPRLHECHAGSCQHKSLFPLSAWEVLGSVLVFLCLSLGVAAGIGGSLILFPIILTLFNFGPHEGIPIINNAAVVVSLVASLMRCRQRRPGGSGPVIDYEIAVLCLPLNYLGAFYAVKFNQACPQWLLVVLIVALLGYILWQTVLL